MNHVQCLFIDDYTMEIEKHATPTISRIPIDVSAIIDNVMISLLRQIGIAIQLSYSVRLTNER